MTRPAWLTERQFGVLQRLVQLLHEEQIPFVASGGLAGNLHGSGWPLQDIDLDVPGHALPQLATRCPTFVRSGPAPYRDAEFALTLLALEIDGVAIDLSAAESVTLITPEREEIPWPTDLAEAELRPCGPLHIPTMPLRALLAYKRRIGRVADVADLERLPPSR